LISIVLLPAFFLILSAGLVQLRVITEDTRVQAERLADTAVAIQQQHTETARQMLTAVAQIPAVREGVKPACDQPLKALLPHYPLYPNIFTSDLEGNSICTAITYTRPINNADRLWFQRILENPTFTHGDYQLGTATGLPVIIYAMPIFNEDGSLRHIVGTGLRLTWIDSLATLDIFPPSTSITAVNQHGVVLYRYPFVEDLIGQPFHNDEILSTVLNQPAGTVQGIGLDGVPRMYAFEKLQEDSTTIIVGLDLMLARADVEQQLIQSMLSLGVLTLVSGAVAWFGSNMLIVQPVTRLITKTRAIATGNLTTRIEPEAVNNTYELAQLGATFNEMADALQSRHQSMEKTHVHLQSRVSESKQQLEFLANAGVALVSSLDQTRILDKLGKLLAPSLTDWVIVDLIEDGAMRRVCISHANPERVQWGWQINDRYPPHYSEIAPSLLQGEPLLVERITDEMIVQGAQNEEHLRILRALNYYSLLATPLMLRGQFYGVITWVTTGESGRILTQEHLELAREINARAIIALENARLFHEATHQRELFRATLLSIIDGVIATDREGKITLMNGSAQMMTGWTLDEAKDQKFTQIYQLEGEHVITLYDQIVRDGFGTHDGQLIARDGQRIPVSQSGAPIHDEQGRLQGVILVFRDITERKEHEKRMENYKRELEEAVIQRTAELTNANAQLTSVNKELEAFSYSVSHDLRTPLRAIDGFSQALQEDFADELDDEAKQHLARVRAGANRMSELIDDLLKLSRLTRMEMSVSPVDLSQIACEILADLAQNTPERRVKTSVVSGLIVQGDARLLRIVLENLLLNAWKFTSKRPDAEIRFGVSQTEHGLAYYVSDNGVGFDMAYANKLFGAFQRLHTLNEFEGTGIGLATVQRIIHRHGGMVWADGVLNEGATFYFTLHPSSINGHSH
jgi:PAS domain S-box-containing protein